LSPALVAFFVVAALLRLGSLLVSKRNEARLRAEGAEESGAGNSLLIAVLHTTFYVAAFVEGWWRGSQLDAVAWFGLALYAAAMVVLLFVIRELGGLWSLKVLLARGHTLKQSWLFRTVRHPNYYLNILPELVGLALVMKAWVVLIVVFPCYVAALLGRIRIEEDAMRRRFPEYPS
jgi:isoprenylcysteine carboxyl methyltransferase (ICMT) family protein YpbQ